MYLLARDRTQPVRDLMGFPNWFVFAGPMQNYECLLMRITHEKSVDNRLVELRVSDVPA